MLKLQPEGEPRNTDGLTEEQAVTFDPDLFGAEPLEGSGFEEEIPDSDCEWRD